MDAPGPCQDGLSRGGDPSLGVRHTSHRLSHLTLPETSHRCFGCDTARHLGPAGCSDLVIRNCALMRKLVLATELVRRSMTNLGIWVSSTGGEIPCPCRAAATRSCKMGSGRAMGSKDPWTPSALQHRHRPVTSASTACQNRQSMQEAS